MKNLFFKQTRRKTTMPLVLLFCLALFAFNSGYAQSFTWANTISGGSLENFTDVVADAAGNTYVCGHYNSTLTIGSTVLPAMGNTNMRGCFVAKFNPAGVPQWVHTPTYGSFAYLTPTAIAVDASGNVYYAGTDASGNGVTTTFDIGNTNTAISNIGSINGFIVKLNSGGVAQFTHSMGYSGAGDVANMVICHDAFTGYVYFGASVNTNNLASASTQNFNYRNPGSGTNVNMGSANNTNFYETWYGRITNTNGAMVDFYRYGAEAGFGQEFIDEIRTDANGNVFMATSVSGSYTTLQYNGGGQQINSTIYGYGIIIKLNASLVYQGTQSVGNTGVTNRFKGLAVKPNGQLAYMLEVGYGGNASYIQFGGFNASFASPWQNTVSTTSGAGRVLSGKGIGFDTDGNIWAAVGGHATAGGFPWSYNPSYPGGSLGNLDAYPGILVYKLTYASGTSAVWANNYYIREGANNTNSQGNNTTTGGIAISGNVVYLAGTHANNLTAGTLSPISTVNNNGFLIKLGCEPGFSVQPVSATICGTQNITFTAAVNGSNNTYQWQKNGVDVNGATTTTLTINNATLADTGAYTLIATNTCGTVTSNPALLTRMPAAPVSSTGLVAYYPAVNINGEFYKDFSASNMGNPGITGGMTSGPDRNGNGFDAFSFPGGGSYLTIGSNPAIASFTNQITIACWFKSNVIAGSQRLIDKNSSNNFLMDLYQSRLRVIILGNAYHTTPVLNSSTWYHAVCTYDGATVKIYINGALVLSTAATGNIANNTAPLRFGADQSGANTLNGFMDEIRIYNRALTESEIGLVAQLPSITRNPVNTTACIGATASFTAAGYESGLTYQWKKNGALINGATNATYTINTVASTDTGTYTCVISNACYNSETYSATLGIAAGATISSHPQNVTVCPGQPAGFSIAITGGSGTYQWKKNGVNISDATGASYNIASVTAADSGSYTCVMTSTCGPQTSNAALLTVNPVTAIMVQPQATSTCQDSTTTFAVTATGTGLLTYQWRKGNTAINDNGHYAGTTTSTLTILNTAAGDIGNYSVSVTGTCGSTTSNAASLSVLGSTSFVQTPASQTVCSGTQIELVCVPSGAGTITYVWKKNNVVIANATNSTFTIPAAALSDSGSYTVTATGTCGSITSPAATVTVISSAAITQQPVAQTVCVNGPFSLSVTGSAGNNTTYQWRKGGQNINGATSATYSVANATAANAGNYHVVITGSCGTVTSNTVAVTVSNGITAGITGAFGVCPGGSTTLTATGGSTYTWSNGLGNNAAVTVSPSANTTYSVTVTNGTCSATASQLVSAYSNPTAAVSPASATVCAGVSTTLNASGGSTYAWSNNLGTASSQAVAPATTTTYTVTVSNANNCSATASATITVNPLPIASISGASSVCAGQPVTLTATGNGIYAWSNSGGNNAAATFTPSATTTYTVTVTGAGNCSATASQAVSVIAVNASINGPTAICAGLSATLTATGGTTYNWSNNETTAAITVTPSAATTYTVTATLSGCTATASQTISVQSGPTASITGSTTVCAGESVTLTANGGNTYSWSNNLGTNAAVTVSPSATSTYTVTASLGANCSASASHTVEVLQPSASTFSQTICNGESFTFDGNSITASGVYTRTIANAVGCDSVITLNLTVLAPVATTISQTICAGDSYDFNGDILTQAGTYYDTLTSVQSCDSVVTLELALGQATSITTQPVASTTVCSGLGFSLDVTADGSNLVYEWIKDNAVIVSSAVSAYAVGNTVLADAGTYKVAVTGTCGADTSAEAVVVINATPEPVIQQNGAVLTSSVTSSVYQWYFNNSIINTATQQSYTATQTGNYKVEVTNADGCTGTSAEVNVIISGIENLAGTSVKVYPNPAADVLFISSDVMIQGVDVYNVLGEKVLIEHGPVNRLQVSTLAQGTYMLSIQTANGVVRTSFVKD
ncbi:MAG TPA: immunoglobulin domain-containing protein [Chitinophagales bacterium]|nr:immunoglobulin domain-containing protein [Chitinophagales bacterium]